ncbi:MAG: FKBP-type peptidyl-prolyl cis-trans isomerase [Chitinophagaceae bacterium]
MIVEDNKIVSIHYVLKDTEGNVLHDNTSHAPEEYLHGANNILPGLEYALYSMKAGNEIEITIPPEYAYGEVEASLIFEVSKEDTPDFTEIEKGERITLFDGTEASVLDKFEDHMIVDANHPLAGQTLHYLVKISGIRDATEEEIKNGEPLAQSNNSCGPEGCC